MIDLTAAQRLRLIREALERSGEGATPENVARQFRRETGQELPTRGEGGQPMLEIQTLGERVLYFTESEMGTIAPEEKP